MTREYSIKTDELVESTGPYLVLTRVESNSLYLKLTVRQQIENQLSLPRDFLQIPISKAGNVLAVVLNFGQTIYVCPE